MHVRVEFPNTCSAAFGRASKQRQTNGKSIAPGYRWISVSRILIAHDRSRDKNRMLKLRLFGGIELIVQDNNVLSIGTRKDTALLVFLALQDRPVERSKIAALMWPDRPEEQARKSLRQSLVGLRRRVNRDQMVLCAERNERMSICSSHLRVDALVFSSLIQSGSFEAAVDLYLSQRRLGSVRHGHVPAPSADRTPRAGGGRGGSRARSAA